MAAFLPARATADVVDILSAAGTASQVTYSSTAKNLNRLSTGDSSAGSKYHTDTVSSRKRRAAMGCKYGPVLKDLEIGAKECNIRVLENDVDEILKVMESRRCDNCANGLR
ncbi:hypothetical protein TL16_g02844 [Triparma laevis f. inornata]|uniref:Uncharacterized protein n=2 Tax=Triparma laevis TaxID=1534972 RepID=A0A9W7KY52_9STRA|nr:hypothetical protein TL16_g02844 [Triparma laevis f. inornata]GMI16142.1 hypothetical protein TrLO_g13748 [Triparma laevis f. longispina]